MSLIADYDYENGSVYEMEYQGNDSDEDTEDASETESMKHEYGDECYDSPLHHLKVLNQPNLGIKEQIYRDKLAELKGQLAEIENGCHQEFTSGVKRLEKIFQERYFFLECCYKWQQERIQHDFLTEEQASSQEFNDRRTELKENLIADLEEKKRLFEADSLELTFDTTEPKPTTTRKLRRRPNDPIPMPDRRRRASPAQINYMLDEGDINDDLKLIAKMSSSSSKSTSKSGNASNLHNYDRDHDNCLIEARISEGKLFYDKRWYHRGQNIWLESMDGSKSQVLILQIGTNEIWCRKQNETTKAKVTLTDLHYKKYILHKRS